MSLILVGLGLCDAQDVTVRGLSFIKAADKVYLEEYTSILQVSKEQLESVWNKKIASAVRINLESNMQQIITEAKSSIVVICFVGDPLFATTHTALIYEAKKQNVETIIVHNASVFSAVADMGLHMYKFGKVTSIPFHNKDVVAPYSILEQNVWINAHTLFLLDLIPTENKFLSIQEALNYLKSIEAIQKKGLITDKTKVVACARLGSKNQLIRYGTYEELNNFDFGKPPFCLIVPASLHFSEKEMLESWR